MMKIFCISVRKEKKMCALQNDFQVILKVLKKTVKGNRSGRVR